MGGSLYPGAARLTLDQTPMTRLLLLVTCRPEFAPSWPWRTYLTPLHLNRLPQAQTVVLVERVAGGKPLPLEVRQQIVTKTDGVPLFVEELTKMVLESGLLQEEAEHYALRGPLPPLAIPATLHDSLMARLDRLASVKAVAQLGATLGRDFTYDLLHAVAPWDAATVQYGLQQLVEAELLYQRGVPPQATYVFKHALIQEAAYQSLLRSTRQQYHQRIAQVLEERFPTLVATQPELVAQHYTAAGLPALAIVYWHRAGQRAHERRRMWKPSNISAPGSNCSRLSQKPPSAPSTNSPAPRPWSSYCYQGYAASDVEQTYARARELCQQVGDTPQLFPVLRGLHRFYLVRGQFQTAHAFGEQCFRLAQQTQDADLAGRPVRPGGEFVLSRGTRHRARVPDAGVCVYTAAPQSSPVFRVVQDLGVSYLVHIAWVLWLCGWPQQALQRCAQALTLAQDLAHPFSQAYA